MILRAIASAILDGLPSAYSSTDWNRPIGDIGLRITLHYCYPGESIINLVTLVLDHEGYLLLCDWGVHGITRYDLTDPGVWSVLYADLRVRGVPATQTVE